MANRGAHAVATRLGIEPVVFPSHHGGFLGGEYGWPRGAGRIRRQSARRPRGQGLTDLSGAAASSASFASREHVGGRGTKMQAWCFPQRDSRLSRGRLGFGARTRVELVNDGLVTIARDA